MLRQLIALFVVLFVVLFAFAWVEQYSLSFQQCIGGSTAQAAEQNSANKNDPIPIIVRAYIRCTQRIANRFNALITALATVLLAAITFGLILSAIDQQRTTRAQLRAYVMIESVAITGISNGEKPDVHVTIKNYGQTPATKVTHWAKLGFSTWSNIGGPIPGRDANERLPESVMGPGSTLHLVTGIDLAFNEETIAALAAQSHALYLKGEVRYVDALGTKRETDFLMFCTGYMIPTGSMAGYPHRQPHNLTFPK